MDTPVGTASATIERGAVLAVLMLMLTGFGG